MKIGLFFGTFNPVHIGHMIIADFMVEFSGLKQVWIVVSPHNPLKNKDELAPDNERLHLVRLAVGDHPKIKASAVEFDRPQPSYTSDTLTFLRKKHPDKQFSLIMGGDNLATLHKWKNYEEIISKHHILLYERPGYDSGELLNHPSVEVLEAPLLNISATFVRKCLRNGHSVQYMLPPPVHNYLKKNPVYY